MTPATLAPELIVFAEDLRGLAAPEARELRVHLGTGTSGARVTLAEASAIFERRHERSLQTKISALLKRTKERWAERERRGAEERAKGTEKQAAKKGARAR